LISFGGLYAGSVVRQEHADAPYPAALLGARRKRPCRRDAAHGDEFAPPKSR
jgi:hypothetical protein